MHCRSGSKKDPLFVLAHSITKRASIHFWSTGLEPSPTPFPARAGKLSCAQGGVGRVPYRMHSVRPTPKGYARRAWSHPYVKDNKSTVQMVLCTFSDTPEGRFYRYRPNPQGDDFGALMGAVWVILKLFRMECFSDGVSGR